MSPFFQSKFLHRFPVTLLLVETLSLGDGSLEHVATSLHDCLGITATDEDVVYLSSRLHRPDDPKTSEVKESHGKNFGTGYVEHINQTSLHDLILYMTGYDYARAEYLYCKVDRDTVMDMVRHFVEMKVQEGIVQFEASLFGSGGKYSDGSSKKDGVVDLRDGFDVNEINQMFMM